MNEERRKECSYHMLISGIYIKLQQILKCMYFPIASVLLLYKSEIIVQDLHPPHSNEKNHLFLVLA